MCDNKHPTHHAQILSDPIRCHARARRARFPAAHAVRTVRHSGIEQERAARLHGHVHRPEEQGHLSVAARPRIRRADAAGAGGRNDQPQFSRHSPTQRLSVLGERGQHDRRQAGRIGQRLLDRSRDGQAHAAQPRVLGRTRPGAPDRGHNGPERARGELRRRERGGAASRGGRQAEAGVGLRPAHRLRLQPPAPEGTARPLDQCRSGQPLCLRGRSRPGQGPRLPFRRETRVADAQHSALRRGHAWRRSAPLRVSSEGPLRLRDQRDGSHGHRVQPRRETRRR